MTVVQCWDDGVTADARLAEILRRHKAKATFNLNPGLHAARRTRGWKVPQLSLLRRVLPRIPWTYKGMQVSRLGWDEMREVYAGFTIGSHTLTHPRLEQIPVEAARREIVESRERLQQFFGQPVLGFAYPFGAYNRAAMDLVQAAGHLYARTVQAAAHPFPPEPPMAFHPSCHFLAPDFWERYEAARAGGVFYFWGHAYEISGESMWAAMEAKICRISSDPGVRWADVPDLFALSGRVPVEAKGHA